MTRPTDDNDRAHDLRKEGDGPVKPGAGECYCTTCGGTGRETCWVNETNRYVKARCHTCRGSGTVLDV